MPEDTPLVRRAVRTGGVLLAVAAAQFAAVFAWVGSRLPGFDLWTTDLVRLGAASWPWGALVSASWIALGVLGTLGLLLSRSAFDERPTRGIGLIALVVAAAAVVVLGLSGLLGSHLPSYSSGLAADVAAVAAAVGLLVVARVMHREQRWHISRVYTLASGAVMLGGVALLAARVDLGLGAGGLQRIVLAAALLWALVEGLHLCLLHRFAPGLQVKVVSA